MIDLAHFWICYEEELIQWDKENAAMRQKARERLKGWVYDEETGMITCLDTGDTIGEVSAPSAVSEILRRYNSLLKGHTE